MFQRLKKLSPFSREPAANAPPADRKQRLGQIVVTEIDAAETLGFDYLLKQSSRRKTLALEVKEARVEVSAPMSMPEVEAHRFVIHKQRWVLNKLREQRQKLNEIADYGFVDGERFYFLGRAYSLVVRAGRKTAVVLLPESEQLRVSLSGRSVKPRAEQVKLALEKWYKQQAMAVLSAKSAAVAERLQVSISSVQLRRTRSKWGHCTHDGVIQYNWLIVQAPEPVVDYLVAHEVCHRVHHNHSKAYWRKVAAVCPGYQPHQRWLKDNGHRLVL